MDVATAYYFVAYIGDESPNQVLIDVRTRDATSCIITRIPYYTYH